MRSLSIERGWTRPEHSDMGTAITEHRRAVLAGWEMRTRSIERALHDGAQQELLGVRLALLRAAAAGGAPDIGVLVERLDEVIDELERLAAGRGPRTVDAGDLRSVLLAVARTDLLAVSVDAPPSLSLPGPVVELLAFLTSECIVNAVTHGHAQRCWVTVTVGGEAVTVSLRDDGHGGAQLRRGGGLEGLHHRVVALGGDLQIDPVPAGAGITVVLPLAVPTPFEADGPRAIAACAAQRALGEELGDPATRIWFWCADAGYCDETGRPAPAGDRTHDGLVRVDVAGHRAALVQTSRPIDALAAALHHRRDVVAGGWAPAVAATITVQLDAERARIDRRMRAAEGLTMHRLTRRCVDQLRAARTSIAAPAPTAATYQEAALGVEAATETLRRIVRRLQASPAEIAGGTSLSDVIAAMARRLGIDTTLSVEDHPDIEAQPAVEQVAEQLLHLADAQPNGRLSIRHRRGATILRCTCGDLPDPASVALLEDVVAQWGGQVSVGRTDGFVTVQARLDPR